MESRARGSGRGSCPVPLLRCLGQRTMSPAADTCNRVRAVAMVCRRPTSPGQGARTEPGIQVALCGRCHLALPHPSQSIHMPVSHWAFSRCQSRPRPVQHVPSSASPVPSAPFAALLLPGDVATTALAPREKGSGVESRRSVISAVSAWLPSQPRQLPFSAVSPPLCSHTAPRIRDCSCLPGCPSPPPAPSGLLPAPLKLLLAQRSQWLQGWVSRAVELLLP